MSILHVNSWKSSFRNMMSANCQLHQLTLVSLRVSYILNKVKMKVKYLVHGIDKIQCGITTLVSNSIAVRGGSIITRLEGAKHASSSFKRLESNLRSLGHPFEIATSDDEVKQMLSDTDVLFIIPFTEKEWPTFKEAMKDIKCKKVVYVLRAAGDLRRNGAFLRSGIPDAWWSERPMIRDFFRAKGVLGKNVPYVVGCNVYELKCQLSAEEITELKCSRKLLQNARFSSFKGSTQTLKVFNELAKDPENILEAWGWDAKESGMTFFSEVKNVPAVKAMWEEVGVKSAMGTYTSTQIPQMMISARFAMDATRDKSDGVLWNDGGLQYCQAEAIDWGAIPVCDSKFHHGDDWDSIMLRFDRKDTQKTADMLSNELRNWNPDKHAKMVEQGREYVRQNLSVQRFNDSIEEVFNLL